MYVHLIFPIQAFTLKNKHWEKVVKTSGNFIDLSSVKMLWNSFVKKITIFRSKRHKISSVVKKGVDPTSSPNVKDDILTSAHQKCEIFHYPCWALFQISKYR